MLFGLFIVLFWCLLGSMVRPKTSADLISESFGCCFVGMVFSTLYLVLFGWHGVSLIGTCVFSLSFLMTWCSSRRILCYLGVDLVV